MSVDLITAADAIAQPRHSAAHLHARSKVLLVAGAEADADAGPATPSRRSFAFGDMINDIWSGEKSP